MPLPYDKKNLPEGDVNTSLLVGVFAIQTLLLMYCAFVDLNNKLYK